MARYRAVMLYPIIHASDPVGLHTADIWEIVVSRRARRQSAGLRHARRHTVLILGFECWTSGATPCGQNVSAMSWNRARVGLHTGDILEIGVIYALAGRALVYVMRVSTLA